MKVAFRVDASAAIGTGHVRRSLALAQALADRNAEIRFLTRRLGVDTPALIARAGFEAVALPAPTGAFLADASIPHAAWAQVDGRQDAAETAAALTDWAPDWVIVDHYAFDARWHDRVRFALGAWLGAIDDVADRRFGVDLLIDHNYARDHRAKYGDRLPAAATVLGGPSYALLGPAFAGAPRYEFNAAVRSIGIFMGGADQPNVSATVLAALANAGFTGDVEVVSTSANPNLRALRAAVAARPGTELTLDLPDLAAFFARHDLQIGAGGGASWERCCIGAPTLLLVIAENQLAVVPDLAQDGIVATVEPMTALDEGAIAAALRSLIGDPGRRAELARRGRALVDGRGAARVGEAMAQW